MVIVGHRPLLRPVRWRGPADRRDAPDKTCLLSGLVLLLVQRGHLVQQFPHDVPGLRRL
jgi:hypothetical protein